jgi:ElaB/YqjD/DUF883 family membrane-anchored ribosome-binding protein
MRAFTKRSPKSIKLLDDITALRRDVSNLVEHLQTGATDGVPSTAAQLEAGARQLYRNLASEAGRSTRAIGRQIEQQPFTSLLIAAGIGYLSGRLLSR